MYIIGKFFESNAARGTRKPILSRYEPPVFIHAELRKSMVLMTVCRRLIPFNIHADIFPAVLFQVFLHVRRIRAHLLFIDCGSVAVPAVPAHRRNHCNLSHTLIPPDVIVKTHLPGV